MSLKLDDSDGSAVSGVGPDVTLDNTLDNSRSNYSSTNNSDGAQQSQTITRNDQHRQQQHCRRELNRISKLKCQKRKLDLVNSLRAEVSQLTTIHNALLAENQQLRQELFLACCNALEHKNNVNQHLFCNQNEQVVRQEELVQHCNAPMQGRLAQGNQMEAYLSQLLANPSMTATSALHHILREVGPQSVAQEGFVMMSQPSSAAHHSLNDDDAGIESAHIRPSTMTVSWSDAQERNVARLPSLSSIDRDMGIESSQHMLSFTMAFPWSEIQEDNAASLPSNVGAHDLFLDGNGIELLFDDGDDAEQPDLTFGPKGSRRG